MSYQHLTLEERYCPAEFREKGLSIRVIARILKRSPSTINRELRRNREKSGYQWTASLLPKGCNFLDVSQAEFDRVLDLINHRPRKRLAWLSSFDVFLRLLLLLDNLPKASAIPSFPRARKKLTCAQKKIHLSSTYHDPKTGARLSEASLLLRGKQRRLAHAQRPLPRRGKAAPTSLSRLLHHICLHAFPAPIPLVKPLNTRLRAEIQHCRRIFPSKTQELTANSPPLIFRQHEYFCDRAKEVPVCQKPQASHERIPIISGDVQRPGQRRARLFQIILSRPDALGKGQKCLCRYLTVVNSVFHAQHPFPTAPAFPKKDEHSLEMA